MDTLKLNISGTLIEVEKSTLLKCEYFKTRLSYIRNNEEVLFVSCDIDAFKDILRYLRFNSEINPKYIEEYKYFLIDIDVCPEEEESFETRMEKKIREIYGIINEIQCSINGLGHLIDKINDSTMYLYRKF